MKKKILTVLKGMGILVALIIIIPMVVSVLLSLIPEGYEGLQTTLTTMLASAYGGVLTLGGVAWTIRKSDKEKKEEEIKRAKPYLKIVKRKVDTTLIEIWQTVSMQEDFQESKARDSSCAILKIENISDAPFLYKKMEINNKEVYGSETVLLTKGKIVRFAIADEYENIKRIFNITIYGEDLLGNRYKYKIQLADKGWDRSIAEDIDLPILIQK